MTGIRGHLGRVRQADDGFSLAEVMVAMTIMLIVLTMTSLTYIGVTRTGTKAGLRMENTNAIIVAFDTMSKTLRTANRLDYTSSAFIPSTTTVGTLGAAQNTGMKCFFYANLGPQGRPNLAYYWYDTATGELNEWLTLPDPASTAPNYTYNSPTWRKRTIARKVVAPTAAKPLFTYYDNLTGLALNSTTDVNAALADSVLYGIGDVGLNMTVTQGATNRTTSTNLTRRVRLINKDTPANTTEG